MLLGVYHALAHTHPVQTGQLPVELIGERLCVTDGRLVFGHHPEQILLLLRGERLVTVRLHRQLRHWGRGRSGQGGLAR